MATIYHICSIEDWEKAKKAGSYEHPSLKEEGFIHCSTDKQVSGVLDRYFEGKTGLVKLVIDTDKLTNRLEFDWSDAMSEEFPHIYGSLNIDAVVEEIPL